MLAGKRAIITGSNSGIGLGIAEELARSGADIVLNSFTDRDEDHDLAASNLGDEPFTRRDLAGAADDTPGHHAIP